MTKKQAVLLLAAATSWVWVAHAQTAKVRVVVRANEFKGTKGQAIVALYNSTDTWLKLDKALKVTKVPIGAASVDVTFEVEPGVYGVSVIHDENLNGKLDFKYFPIPGPVEGAGVSNDATATFGPPSWKDSKIRISDVGGLVAVRVRY